MSADTMTKDEGLRLMQAEIDRLREANVRLQEALVADPTDQTAEIERLRGALIELRLRLHAAGRRPEGCYEISLIDEALRRD